MLRHISQTRPLQRFSNPEVAPDNLIPFPRHQSRNHRVLGVEAPDWKERRITQRQLWYIRILAQQNGIRIQDLNDHCYHEFGADLATMTRPMASDVIQGLKRKFYAAQRHDAV